MVTHSEGREETGVGENGQSKEIQRQVGGWQQMLDIMKAGSVDGLVVYNAITART